jgi:hypothetical protein
MAISNDILSSTLRILKDQEVDNLYKAVPLLENIRAMGGVEEYDGGQKVNVPMILAEHSTITQLSTGYEPVSLSAADALRQAEFNWCDYVAPIIITKKEELSNKGEKAIISIAEARMKSVMGLIKRETEKQLLRGDSAILSELLTLNGHVGIGSVNGFLEDDPFGNQTNVVGGLDKALFPNDLQNQRVNGLNFAAGSENVVEKLTDLYIEAQLRTPDGSAPNLIMCSPALYRAYKAQMFNQERFIDEQTLDGGKLALAFNGAKIYASPFMDSTLSATSNQINAYALNTKFMKLMFDRDANFEMSDFIDATGYASRYAYLTVRAQMAFSHLASQGIATGGSN